MSRSKPIVVIYSDDSNYAGALSAILISDFEVQVFDSRDTRSFAEIVRPVAPAVLVHDSSATGEMTALGDVARACPTLVLGPDEAAVLIEAVEAGAIGYMSRESALKEIKDAIMSIAQGAAIIPPFMLGSLLRHVVERRRHEAVALQHLDVLTEREREVFELASLGLGAEDLAGRLFISPATARTHLQRIFKKLNIHSKAELVALAASCGIATSEES